jgi:hypothetical protein
LQDWFSIAVMAFDWLITEFSGDDLMSRLARVELFSPDELAIVHVMNRVGSMGQFRWGQTLFTIYKVIGLC